MTSFHLEVIYVSQYTKNSNNENRIVTIQFLLNLGKYVSCISKCVCTCLADGIGDT